jgi:hypothetical protein
MTYDNAPAEQVPPLNEALDALVAASEVFLDHLGWYWALIALLGEMESSAREEADGCHRKGKPDTEQQILALADLWSALADVVHARLDFEIMEGSTQ